MKSAVVRETWFCLWSSLKTQTPFLYQFLQLISWVTTFFLRRTFLNDQSWEGFVLITGANILCFPSEELLCWTDTTVIKLTDSIFSNYLSIQKFQSLQPYKLSLIYKDGCVDRNSTQKAAIWWENLGSSSLRSNQRSALERLAYITFFLLIS